MSDIYGVEGSPQARVMLIGECWGETEEKVHRPFQGQAGKILDGILEEVDIPRAMCRITNVLHERPPNNNFLIYYEKNKPTPKLLEAYERLANEITACQPNLVVCLGNEAMKAVLGHGGIMDWRGSIFYSPLHGKVMPTIHPAAILRDWTLRPSVVSDFEKVREEMMYAEIKSKKKEIEINPSLETILEHIDEARQSDYCAFDIETESNQITCLGIAYKPDHAICIPFWFGSSGSIHSQEDEQLIWIQLRELLEADSPKKIAHNGMYELEYLSRTMGIIPKIHLDTMLMFHTLYAELPKSLAYLVSIYTDHPFYKYQRKTDKMDEMWTYNGTDAMLTYECAKKLIKELYEEKRMGFYIDSVHSLMDPLFGMTRTGVRFDHEKRKDIKKVYEDDFSVMQQKLNNLVGHALNIGSHKQMTEWLYKELKLPKQTKKRKATGDETETADEEALNNLYKKHPKEEIKLVLEMREKQKLLSTYLNVKIDDDKRIRCSYNIAGTETGRLSSSSTAFGTGTNLQNIPDGIIRSMFVADERYTLINADLSQAEARVVAYISGDQRLIEIFEQGGDIHKKNAANIYNCKEEEVTDEQRYLAKRVVHASNYGMGPRTFAQTAGISESEATRLLNRYFAAYPRIKFWHMQVRSQLDKTRVLVNPFGRKRIFFNRLFPGHANHNFVRTFWNGFNCLL